MVGYFRPRIYRPKDWRWISRNGPNSGRFLLSPPPDEGHRPTVPICTATVSVPYHTIIEVGLVIRRPRACKCRADARTPGRPHLRCSSPLLAQQCSSTAHMTLADEQWAGWQIHAITEEQSDRPPTSNGLPSSWAQGQQPCRQAGRLHRPQRTSGWTSVVPTHCAALNIIATATTLARIRTALLSSVGRFLPSRRFVHVQRHY